MLSRGLNCQLGQIFAPNSACVRIPKELGGLASVLDQQNVRKSQNRRNHRNIQLREKGNFNQKVRKD